MRVAEIQARRHGKDPSKAVERIERDLRAGAQGEPSRYCCVALRDDTVVGFGKCAYLEWSSPTTERGRDAAAGPAAPPGWYLAGVLVEPEHRRRGVARALTGHRLDWLQGRTDVVYYWVDEVNRASIDLHRDFGFEEVARGLRISSHHNDAPQALFRLSWD